VTINPKIALLVAKSAPVIAAVTLISSVESSPADPWTAVFRIGISSAVGVFLTLIGLVYLNLDKRITDIEKEHVPRNEYSGQLENLKEWTKNIERKIDRLIERRH
jgi:hypothetical protein